MFRPSFYPAVIAQYSDSPILTITVDGVQIQAAPLVSHSVFKSQRITLPRIAYGTFPQFRYSNDDPSFKCEFESIPASAFSTQQLFHYYDIVFRGKIFPYVYLDGHTSSELQTQQFVIETTKLTDNIRVYFNPLAYGYTPHIWNGAMSLSSTTGESEIISARPVALPPRFYRGIRTHSEFQITFKGDVDIEWYLDGVSIGTYDFTSANTVTEKAYFQSGTIGHVLQYIHTNPEDGGKIYIVETDVTLADLEQQGMRPQPEER
jgi:hypothetical protein